MMWLLVASGVIFTVGGLINAAATRFDNPGQRNLIERRGLIFYLRTELSLAATGIGCLMLIIALVIYLAH